jgi:4-hydroxy-tetrahydrodipicolinate synthase
MMDVIKDMSGIIAVVNTPFTQVGEIDVTALRKYVDFAIHVHVVGFLISARATEVNKLTFAERQLIAKTVTESSGPKIPVIGGTAASTQAERLNLSKMFLDNGCAGILINIPFQDDNQYLDFVAEIADLNPKILIIQDLDFHGSGLPVSLISKLFDTVSSFNCLKVEVVPAGVKYTEVIQATKERLHVSGGWACTQMIEALDRGVNAFMPTILHDIYNKIFQLHRHGDRERAGRLFLNLVPILAFSHQHLDISIHFNKQLLNRQGIFSSGYVRQPILKFDDYHRRIATDLIDKAIILSQSLHEY